VINIDQAETCGNCFTLIVCLVAHHSESMNVEGLGFSHGLGASFTLRVNHFSWCFSEWLGKSFKWCSFYKFNLFL